MVGMARTAHEIARNTGVSLRNADSELLLGFRHGLADGAAHQLDVLDPARIDPLDGFRDDACDVNGAFGRLLADGHHDRRAAQIDGNGIILSFHGILSFYFLQTTWSLYLMSIVRYSFQPIDGSPRR